MTVKELIEKLQKLPEDAKVKSYVYSWTYTRFIQRDTDQIMFDPQENVVMVTYTGKDI